MAALEASIPATDNLILRHGESILITTYLSYEAASLSRKAASSSHKRKFPSYEAISLSRKTTFLPRIMTGNSAAIEVPASPNTSGRTEQSLTDHGQFTKNRCFRCSGEAAEFPPNPGQSRQIPHYAKEFPQIFVAAWFTPDCVHHQAVLKSLILFDIFLFSLIIQELKAGIASLCLSLPEHFSAKSAVCLCRQFSFSEMAGFLRPGDLFEGASNRF